MPRVTFARLKMDEAGESYFQDEEIQLEPKDFAPPAPPLGFAPAAALGQGFFIGADQQWAGEVPHPAPQKQLLVVMQGEFSVTASNGDERRFTPGSMLMLEDIAGKGHQTRILGDTPTLVFGAVVQE